MRHRLSLTCLAAVAPFLFLLPRAHAERTTARQTPLVRAIQRVRPAVVNIRSQKTVSTPNALFPHLGPTQNHLSGMGTGVIVDERGFVVTNYHVIEEVSSIRATLVDGSTHTAEVIARDPETDLALLKIHPLGPLEVMPLGTSDDLMYGETVFAVGNAFGYEHTITQGIISELHRDVRLSERQAYYDLIQTDASINPGNSGGPLINMDGEMIGLNVAIRAGAQGIGFAIPVNKVKEVLAKLLGMPPVTSVRHGIEAAPLGPEAGAGLDVRVLEPGGPGALAGLSPGDRLLRIGPVEVQHVHDLERAMIGRGPGDRVPVHFVRGSQPLDVTMVLGPADPATESPADFVWRRLGARLAAEEAGGALPKVSEQLRGGLRIIEVSRQGLAAKAGIGAGDILVGLHHWETLSIDNIVYVLNQSKSQQLDTVRFFVVRDGKLHRGWLNLSRPE